MKKVAIVFLPFLFIGNLIMNSNVKAPVAAENQHDGPYVMCTKDRLLVKYIFSDSGDKKVRIDSMPLASKFGLIINVATDEPGKTFQVKLKDELKAEKSEHSNVDKQFVVSDIEGNFGAFRKLLQANGIINEELNWTFGEGHLVLTGDFFDRGSQQTEVLWLIYALEDKAKAAGGYVHFILGNHEIMNMNGDLRYLHAKYLESANLLNEDYMNLYSENSELGKWLRTKNVIEKVGKVLYIHGGISPTLNNAVLSASRINKLANPYYGDTLQNYKDERVELIYGNNGPFWYRGYYAGEEKATIRDIKKTLAIYNVKYIATGHTVISDTVSVLHEGMLFNTDVHHSAGHSEGLYIDNHKFYRATANGEKFLIHENK